MTTIARQLTEAVYQHGEGPVWDARTGTLRTVDMLRGDVLQYDPEREGRLRRVHVADHVATLRPRESGGWIIATGNGFALADDDLNIVRRVTAFDGGETVMNEGGCDSAGSFYCGTVGPGASGSLYRCTRDFEVEMALTGVTISNGLCASPDGTMMYYVDTPTGRIDVFDTVDGGLAARRPFVRFEADDGQPDGVTVDSEGGVWVAMWGAGTVRRYEPDGTLTEKISFPTAHVTACAFGGDALGTLYVTSSQQGLDLTSDRSAGALFAVEVGVRGLLPLTYAG